MNRYIVALVLLFSAACGGREPKVETQTFGLKYLSPDEARNLVAPYLFKGTVSSRQGQDSPGAMSATNGAITIRETRENLERIARVLAQFDVPRPLVRLTFHLIQADGAATSDPAIADVEAVLRRLFRFRGYRMVEEGVFSASEGGEVTQQLGGAGYLINAEIRRVAGMGDSAIVQLVVHLRGRDVQFGTQVGIPVGKTAVLGNVGTAPRGTLILTVKPELVSVSP
jgi:hypothetical protein